MITQLKNINFTNILVVRDNKIIDYISKDLTCSYCPFNVIGSDSIYSALELTKNGWIKEGDKLLDADKVKIK